MPHERCASGCTRSSRRSSGLLSSGRSRCCSWSRRSRRGTSVNIRLCSGSRRLLRCRCRAGTLCPGRSCCRRCRLGLWRGSRRSSSRRPFALGGSPSRRCWLLHRRCSAGTLSPARRCCRRCRLAVRCRSRWRSWHSSWRRPFTGNWPSDRPLARSRSLAFLRLYRRRGRRLRRLRGRWRGRMRHLGWSMRRRCCRRRRTLRWSCSWRRRLWLLRGTRRCCSGRHGALRRCDMGRRSRRCLRRWTFRRSPRRLLLMLLPMIWFPLRLRNLNSRRLRMRCQGCKLHRRQSRRGKQHETKFCHDGPNPPGRSSEKPNGGWTDQQPAMGPDCGAYKSGNAFYFVHTSGCMRNLFIARSAAILVRAWAQSNLSRDSESSALAIPVTAFRPELVRAIRQGATARPARARAVGLRDADCRAGLPSAVRSVVQVLAAGCSGAQSASTSPPCVCRRYLAVYP